MHRILRADVLARPVVCAVLALSLLLSLGKAFGQVEHTGVGGTITDPSGRAMAGATVTVRNTDTNVVTTEKTNSYGIYQFPNLEAGTYVLTVVAQGFDEEKSNAFTLLNGAPARVDLKVKVGAVTESVDVSESQTQLLNTTNNSVSFAIDNRQVENLPINERNLLELVALQPGVSTEEDGGTAQNSRGGFEVNGAPGLSNNILLDGVDATFGEDNGAGSGNTGTIGPVINTVGIGAISEFRTTTSVPPAEFGRALGGILTINTKFGANHFHGQAFEYFRNDVMDANNWVNKHTPGHYVPVPELRFHEFGANLGGPILRNHAFFFANYEGARENVGVSHTFDVPGESLLINMKNPLAEGELRLMPQGNVPHASNLNFWMEQWIGNVVNPTVEDTGLARVDVNYGKHHDMVRFDVNNQDQGIVQTPRISDTLEYPFRFYNAVLEDDWTLKSNVLNTIRVGLDRNDLDRHSSTYYTDPYKTTIMLDGYFNSDTNVSHLHFLTTTYNLIDNVTWVKGRHQFLFGTDDRSLRSIRIQDGFSSVDYNTITNTFNDAAYQVSIIFGGHKHFSDYQFAGYAQDSFRATPRLTLNLGLRYEKYTPLHGAFNVSTSDPFGPMNQSNDVPYMSENNWNFIPRVGFIEDITGKGKLLFSGGFGLMFIPPQPFFYYDSSSVAPNLPFDSTLTKADVPASFSFAFPISKDLLNSIEADPSLATGVRFGRTIANPHHPDEYAINWNAQLQYQIRKDLTVKAIYTAMRSMHGQALTLPNQFAAGACPTTSTCTARPNPAFGSILFSQDWARIWYDGLYFQASLRNRLAEGNVYYAFASDIQTWGREQFSGNGADSRAGS